MKLKFYISWFILKTFGEICLVIVYGFYLFKTVFLMFFMEYKTQILHFVINFENIWLKMLIELRCVILKMYFYVFLCNTKHTNFTFRD